jgi:putative membrane protein insertion efficiency factor
MNLINKFFILIIKFYKHFISPYFGASCRYLPTCSEYFIDSLKLNGFFKGTYLGLKRILKCHPIKILGGSSGFDPAPNLKKEKK